MISGDNKDSKVHLERVHKGQGSGWKCLWGDLTSGHGGTITLEHITFPPSDGRVNAKTITTSPVGVATHNSLSIWRKVPKSGGTCGQAEDGGSKKVVGRAVEYRQGSAVEGGFSYGEEKSTGEKLKKRRRGRSIWYLYKSLEIQLRGYPLRALLQ